MQKGRAKFKSLYFPGLISLVGLPLILIFHLYVTNAFKKDVMMNVTWFDDAWIRDYNSLAQLKFEIPKRNYTTVKLTGNIKQDQPVIDALDKSIKKINKDKDTLNGYKVDLTHGTYAGLVGVLDVCKLNEKEHGFFSIPYHDQVYIVYRIMHPKSYFRKGKLFFCGTMYYKPRPTYQTDLTVLNNQLITAGKSIWTIWPALIFLLPMILPEKLKFILFKRSPF